jgi:hypothetical protein
MKIPWKCHDCHFRLKRRDLTVSEGADPTPKYHDGIWVYCYECWNPRVPLPMDDPSQVNNNNPWGDNAVRALEGD